MIFDWLEQLVVNHQLRLLDLYFAQFLAPSPEQSHLALAAAMVSYETGLGNVCLPINQLSVSSLVSRFPSVPQDIVELLAKLTEDSWEEILLREKAVSTGNSATPIILFYGCLYLQRLWHDEGIVANFFSHITDNPSLNETKLVFILNQLFPNSIDEEEVNWQKIAVAIAVTRRITLIAGGPGTGKTTIVAKILLALIRLYPKPLWRIYLAAPTGKAAGRLIESVKKELISFDLSDEENIHLPKEAHTIHRLLGIQINTINVVRHYNSNPLHVDLLIIDESSMVDLSIMARLLSALPNHARLVLLGDRDQLASIEAGAVFGDLCHFGNFGFSPQQSKQLFRLCKCKVPINKQSLYLPICDSICLLKKNYRFSANSGINQLAYSVKQGDICRVVSLLSSNLSDIFWYKFDNKLDFLIEKCVSEYSVIFEQISHGNSPSNILNSLHRFRLLCALREGPFGQQGMNEQITNLLQKKGIIKKEPAEVWYAGRPVMITRNNAQQHLYNGDIGITMRDNQNRLRVYFRLPNGVVKGVLINRLVDVDTVYAMTIHKSQGSEFDHACILLPNIDSSILSRSLLYTAITRAKKQVTLCVSPYILLKTVNRVVLRNSGLTTRILSNGL